MDFIVASDTGLIAMSSWLVPLLICVSVFFFGEFAVLSFFILSVEGSLNTTTVFISALCGTLFADFFWFFLGRHVPLLQRSRAFRAIQNLYKKRERLFLRHPGLILLVIKYVYGFRWSTIIYYASSALPTRTYLLLNMLGSLIYVSTLCLVGIVTGLGLYNLLGVYHVATLILFAIVAGVAIAIVVGTTGRFLFREYLRLS